MDKKSARIRRATRARRKLQELGATRLVVHGTPRHIYAQVIDDVAGNTLVSASSLDKDLKLTYGGNATAAKAVGEAVAKKAIAAGIEEVVFDRGGYIYHGRVAALAEGAREAGLKF